MMDGREERESIWGIDRKDRIWFQLLTLIGGTIISTTLAALELIYRSAEATPNTVAQNIVISIGTGFVAAGFIAWSILQAKELTMAIADWIRERTERNRERNRRLLIQQGLQRGIQQGRQEGRLEGYSMGYEDATKGKPPQPPKNASDERDDLE